MKASIYRVTRSGADGRRLWQQETYDGEQAWRFFGLQVSFLAVGGGGAVYLSRDGRVVDQVVSREAAAVTVQAALGLDDA